MSPAQWLHNSGVPQEYYLTGLRFWTGDTPSKFYQALQGMRDSHFFVDITNEDTLYRSDPPAFGHRDEPGHALRAVRLMVNANGIHQPYPFPMNSNGDAGYRRPQLARKAKATDGGTLILKANNGKYLSRIAHGSANPIEAAKDTPDQFCVFTLNQSSYDFVTLRADNGKLLSWMSSSSGETIEAAKDAYDQYCLFELLYLDNGKVTLSAWNGKFLCPVLRGDRQAIEAARDVADGSCQFDYSTQLAQSASAS